MPEVSLPSIEDIVAQAQMENPAWLLEAVDTETASLITGEAEASLETKRSRGGGPPFVKMGALARYIRLDLFRYMIERRRTSTSDPGPQVAA